MGQAVSLEGSLSRERLLPFDVLWGIIFYLGDNSLRAATLLNQNLNDICNLRLFKSFTIDYTYDWRSARKRRRDILERCHALLRKPARAACVRYLVIQYDAALGTQVGISSRAVIERICDALMVTTKLDRLLIHAPFHRQILGAALSARAPYFKFRLKTLTTSLVPSEGIERFIALQAQITSFEANRADRLEVEPRALPKGPELSKDVMPNLKVVYTGAARAAGLIRGRSLHTVEITSICSLYSASWTHASASEDVTANVEHLCVNLEVMAEDRLPMFIQAWGIAPSSIRYLHLSTSFSWRRPTYLSSLPSLEGIEFSEKKKSKTFPLAAISMSHPEPLYETAGLACAERCPSLRTMVWVQYLGTKETWRVISDVESYAHGLPSVTDVHGKVWERTTFSNFTPSI